MTMRQDLKVWGKDLKSRLLHRREKSEPGDPGIHVAPSTSSISQDRTDHPQSSLPLHDLWQAAYDKLDPQEQETLSTSFVRTQLRSSQDARSTTEVVIDHVIERTKREYESYQEGGLKIHRSTGEVIDVRKCSRKIIDAALSFKEIVGAVVAYDPTCYAASAWAVVSLGLTMAKNRLDLRDALLDSSEYLADVIARCAYIEKRIYRNELGGQAEVGTAIIKVYKVILEYAAEMLTAQKSNVGRWLQDSVAAVTKQRLDELHSSVKEEEQYLHQWVQMDQYLRHDEQAELLLTQCDKMIESLQALVQNFSLPTAEGAFYDSYENQHEDTCLPGTRTELLGQVTDWAGSSEGKRIFWLSGMAGTGKSTIARTVAQSLQDKGLLGATFFFKKGEADRGNARRFISTVAKELITNHRELAPAILEAIQKDPNISSKALSQQFDHLLLRPLVNLKLAEPIFTVIVVDALDECEDEEDIKVLLHLLPQLQKSTSLHVQFFLTTRPELPIRIGFQQIEEYQDLVVHELPKPVIEHDIRLFLQDRLRKIQQENSLPSNWPGEEITDVLVSRTVPLFIFAATLCRFVGEKYQVPEERLEAVLKDSTSSGSHMERTYLPIFNKLLKEAEARNFATDVQEMLGAVILLRAPLSVNSLALLLDIPERRIRSRLAAFHSVLIVPSNGDAPVRTLHSSFGEFLLNTTSSFHVDEKGMHRRIALHCLRVMESHLKHNICGLSSYGTNLEEIDKDTICTHLSAELQYSCRYWIHHLHHAKDQDYETEVLLFLKRHFLHWLEAMSLMGSISEVVSMINVLQSIIGSNLSVELPSFLHDAKLFVLKNIYICTDFPLQVYCSGLAFWPPHSVIREVFHDSQRWVYFPSQVESSKATELRSPEQKTVPVPGQGIPSTMTLSDHSIVSVAFSPDGRTVACGSKDNAIRFWDVKNGRQIRTLEGHSDSVSSVVFSPDGQAIASGSYDKTVKLWDVKTSCQMRTLEGHCDSVVSVDFSPNGQVIASSADDNMIKLWDAKTGRELCTLEGHFDWVQSVAFSPDGQTLASGSYDNTIKVWDVKTSQQMQTLEGHSSLVASVTFSPDGQIIASGSYDHTIRLWDVKTGQQLRTLEGHCGLVRSVVVSPNSQVIASGSYDNDIRLWDSRTGELLHTLEGHSSPVRSVVFSPDGQTLASGSYDKTIKLWSVETGRYLRTLETHSDSLPLETLSLDDQLVQSNSALSVEDGWVTFAAEKVLWLPFDYREFSSSTARGSALTLGYPDGRVCDMEFRPPTV